MNINQIFYIQDFQSEPQTFEPHNEKNTIFKVLITLNPPVNCSFFFLNAEMWCSGTQCCQTAAALKGSAFIWLVIAILQPSDFSQTF